MSEDSDSDIIKDFLVESYENLDRTWSAWRIPHDRDALSGVFRAIHTIKGTLRLSGFPPTAPLGMVDAVRQMLGSIEVSDAEGERDDTQLIATLTRLRQSPEAPAKGAVVAVPEPSSYAAELSSSIGDILMQRDRVTELLDIPAILRKS